MLRGDLTEEQRASWAANGFFIVEGFADASVCDAMLGRVVEIAREADGQVAWQDRFVMPEQNLTESVRAGAAAEERASKIFRLHRHDAVFRDFVRSPEVLRIGARLLGPNLDCFLSQFIFKNPGAWGQPWHQDSFYFPFDRSPQVGLWVAVTEATEANGCLWVLPGSHTRPVAKHVPDTRPNANLGYVEIEGVDFSAEVPVCMAPGDLLVFHSHLMHRSKDNESDGLRAAMVYHLAERGTRDIGAQPTPVNDWVELPDPPA